VGSAETVSVACDAAGNGILALVALSRARTNTVATLGLLWLCYAVYDFVYLTFHWVIFNDFANYFVTIVAMAWIAYWQWGHRNVDVHSKHGRHVGR
jgi:hypothetical protein